MSDDAQWAFEHGGGAYRSDEDDSTPADRLRVALEALRLAVADVNDLDAGQRLEPATVDGYLRAAERGTE